MSSTIGTGLESPDSKGSIKERGTFMLGFVAVFWIVEALDAFTPLSLDIHGIRPWKSEGLWGVLWSPFLHGDWQHLIGNTVPFFILGCLVMFGGMSRFLAATAVIMLVAGLGTWFFGERGSLHIGASGLVFGYLGYVVTYGFFRKSIPWILTGVAVGVFYSWMIMSLLKFPDGISWAGHFFGLAGGVVAAAWIGRRERAKEPANPLVL